MSNVRDFFDSFKFQLNNTKPTHPINAIIYNRSSVDQPIITIISFNMTMAMLFPADRGLCVLKITDFHNEDFTAGRPLPAIVTN